MEVTRLHAYSAEELAEVLKDQVRSPPTASTLSLTLTLTLTLTLNLNLNLNLALTLTLTLTLS